MPEYTFSLRSEHFAETCTFQMSRVSNTFEITGFMFGLDIEHKRIARSSEKGFAETFSI